MSKKMTISELRTFIQEGVMKLYAIHILEERKKQIDKKLSEDNGEKFGDPHCMENPKVCMSKPGDITAQK